MTAQIIVVNEDGVERRYLKSLIEQGGYYANVLTSPKDCLNLILQSGASVDAIILSVNAGIEATRNIIETTQRLGHDIPVIIISAPSGISSVVDSLRLGAFDFIVKPVSPERLFSALDGALKLHLAGKKRPRRKARSGAVQFSALVSASSDMTRVLNLARKAAHHLLPVVIEGEAGVGKALIARAIHFGSDRSPRPFISIDCFGKSDAELERELLGPRSLTTVHMDSAFGGKLLEADGGTLVLHDVGELPLSLQTRLLAIVEGAFPGQMSTSKRRFNVRIITTTSKNLIEEVRAGRFREDLYYRLSVYPIAVPALRRRPEDIPHLARHFLEQFSFEHRKSEVHKINQRTLELLSSYDWPGNVRQLENAIYRAVTLASSIELSEPDFAQIIAQLGDDPRPRGGLSSPALVYSKHDINASARTSISKINREAAKMGGGHGGFRAEGRAASIEQTVAPAATIASMDDQGHVRTLAEIEEELIRFALGFYRGQMSQVARKLGIGRSTLYRKLKDYGIDPDDPLRDVA